jgi:hypothetical protein
VTDAPKRVERTADEVLGSAILRAELRPVRGAMRAFARSIRQVHPTDPVLAKGGVTLATLAREIAVLGDSPNRCADLEAWQRAGWPRGRGPRVHTPQTSSAKEDRRIRAELFRLGRRLRALGSPAEGVRPLMLTNLFGLSDALTAAATLGPMARREAPVATTARALLGR